MSTDTIVCAECKKEVDVSDPGNYLDHINSKHATHLAGISANTNSNSTSLPAVHCKECGSTVEESKFFDHINSNHQLHRIEIKGAGTVLVPNQSLKAPVMLDLPYIGRIRRDAFMAWSLVMFILGVVFAGWYWRVF